MAESDLRLVHCRMLATNQRRQAAGLVITSFAEFYARMKLDPGRLLDLITDELALEGTELEHVVAAIGGGEIRGIMCSYPSDELKQRQIASLFHMASGLNSNEEELLFNELSTHAASTPKLPEQSYYLARLAVARQYQNQGVANFLLLRFAGLGNLFSCLSLHVLESNARAVAFYRKHGFQVFGDGSLPYVCMSARLN